MDINTLLSWIEHYGYAALFFSLWLGIIGMPVPDEVIVMAGGFIASMGLLKPIPAFIITYLGVAFGLTLGFFLGRIFGRQILDRLARKGKVKRYIDKSQNMIEKYGARALFLSYLFSMVRHIVPYLVGIGNMPFRVYALYSYTTGFVWTLLFFLIGMFFGNQLELIGSFVHQYSLYALFVLVLAVIVVQLILKSRKFSRD